MSQIAINTSQNVNIDFMQASIGSRMVAFLIDTAVKLCYLMLVYYAMYQLSGFGYYIDSLDMWSQIAIQTIISFPVIIYTLAFETLTEGQTFGKKIMKIRTVKIDGYQASFGDYLIRWVFNLVDIYSNMGIIGLVSAIVSKNNQRLGDIASGTAVISLKSDVNISHTILENLAPDYTPVFPQVIALSDNDMRIIKENYQKALRVDDVQIIKTLASKIKEILKTEIDEKSYTDRQFINVVIKDYNYYTGKEI